MASRRQIKGVANNLAQWLLSRNFDYQGYWAIGQLYEYAETNKKNPIVLNLKERSLFPESEEGKFGAAIELASNILNSELSSKNIPESWLQEVIITFTFNTPYQHQYHNWGSALGKPFVCTVNVTSDLGKTYVSERGGNCWLHNPKKEQRRHGFE